MDTDLHDQQRQRVEEFQKKHRIALLTMLFTDLVGSTRLKQILGDHAAIALMERHHTVLRETLARFPEGEEISTAGDSFFIVFAKPSDATHFALLAQNAVRALARETGQPLLDRIGIHVGEIFIQQRSESQRDLFGIQIDTAARVMSLGDGDQVLLSRFAFDNARQVLRGLEPEGLAELSWLNHGYYEMKGVEEPLEICEVGEKGLAMLSAPGDSAKAHRFHAEGAEPVLGWRPAAGQLVPNTRWTLERPLGEGGFGEVWLACHEKLKQQRVFKFCFNAERARSLKREVTLFRILRERVGEHPGIVAIHDVFFDEPPYYIVMDFVDGPTLSNWGGEGGIASVPLEARLEVIAQVADALQAAHDAGVIHRDVKPSNIMVMRAGDLRQDAKSEPSPPLAKLTDFGIGQVTSAEALVGVTQLGFTQTMLYSGSATGTQVYMAPELLAGQTATTRSDIYSLGVVLWQVAIGDFTRPFTTDWPEEIADPLLREDIRRCVAGDPLKRFAGAAQLAVQLRALDKRRTAAEQEEKRVAVIERRAYRRGMIRTASLALGIVVLVAALAVYALRQAHAARTSARAEADAARNSDEMLTKMQLQRAEELFAADDDSAGLAYLAAVVRRHPSDQITASRLLSALRDRSHPRPLLKPLHHEGSVSALEWSPDGRRLLTVTRNRIRLWDTATGELVLDQPPTVAGGYLSSVCFSPDGRRFLASGSEFQVFDIETGKAVSPPLSLEDQGPNAFSNFGASRFSPDGKQVVTVTHSKKAKIWDAESGKEVAGFDTDGLFGGNAISSDGAWLAVISGIPYKHTITLWNMSTRRIEHVWKDLGAVSNMNFSKDNTRLFFQRGGHAVVGFDLGTKDFLPWKIENDSEITDLSLSPDGHTFAVSFTTRFVRFFSADSGKYTGEELRHTRYADSVHYSSDGARIVTTTDQPAVHIWDAFTKRSICSPCPANSAITSVRLSPDGLRLAVGTAAGEVKLWDISARESQPVLFGPAGKFAVSSDEHRIATVAESRATLWDLKNGEKLGMIEHGAELWTLAFHPQTNCLFTAGALAAGVRSWNSETGKVAAATIRPTNWVGRLSFSSDGRFLCIGANSEKIRVWDLSIGREASAPFGNSTVAQKITPDGNRVIAGECFKNEVLTFDVASGQQVGVPCKHDAEITSLIMNPDGQRFASASNDGRVRVWSTTDSAPITPWMQHQGEVTDISFSLDGKLLATASADRTARVWSIPSGLTVDDPVTHTERVYSAQICPDGRRLATSSYDGTVRVWDTQTGRALSDRLPLQGAFVTTLKWTHDGTHLLGGGDGILHLWDVPAIEGKAPDWLPAWAEVVAGRRLNAHGTIEPVGDGESAALVATIAALGNDDTYTRTAKWFFAKPGDRPISPAANLHLADYVRLLCESDSQNVTDTAVHLAPTDARALARHIEQRAFSSEFIDKAALETLRFHLAHAEALNPKEPLVWRAKAALYDKIGETEMAIETFRKAVALDPRDWRAQQQLGRLLARTGDIAAAIAAISEALDHMDESGYGNPQRRELLTLRYELLRKTGHDEEAAKDNLELRPIEHRDSKATQKQIDLTAYYTRGLDEEPLGADNHGWNFGEIPHGLQTMSDRVFDIRGMVELKHTNMRKALPKEVCSIRIAQSCTALHFVHALMRVENKASHPVANYVVHYDDGTLETIPVMKGRDIAEVFRYDGKRVTAPLTSAWTGQTAYTRTLLEKKGTQCLTTLFKMTWHNPRPDKPIQSLDFVSADPDAATVLFAITAE